MLLIHFINCLSLFPVFRGSEVKPDKYETRNCYPTQNKETLEIMEKKLNELIQCRY